MNLRIVFHVAASGLATRAPLPFKGNKKSEIFGPDRVFKKEAGMIMAVKIFSIYKE